MQTGKHQPFDGKHFLGETCSKMACGRMGLISLIAILTLKIICVEWPFQCAFPTNFAADCCAEFCVPCPSWPSSAPGFSSTAAVALPGTNHTLWFRFKVKCPGLPSLGESVISWNEILTLGLLALWASTRLPMVLKCPLNRTWQGHSLARVGCVLPGLVLIARGGNFQVSAIKIWN